MKLSDKIKETDSYPFHMPGHKRNPKYEIVGSELDFTEIDGLDNLHNPQEIIKELQDDIAKLFGYRRSIISVNGSTCGILAALSAVSKPHETIIVARNCHKSVYNACIINKLNIEYIEPDFNTQFGVWGKVTQEEVDKAIKRFPKACAVVITSPTYEGITSEIKCEIPLIIDAAHGAHFGFADWLPKRANGDIVIQSLHKTLPALTQTALVHINNTDLYPAVKKYMDIYETSSPSYLLMNSVDKCVDILKDSNELFNSFKSRLYNFYNEINKLSNISVMNNDDISRIVINADGFSGYELSDYLRSKGIEPEGAGLKNVILISSICDTDKGFNHLIDTLKSIPSKEKRFRPISKPQIPQKACEIYDSFETAETPLDEAYGCICGEFIYAYPPAAPIVAPGELIDKETIDYIKELRDSNVNIISDSNLLPLKILTKA